MAKWCNAASLFLYVYLEELHVCDNFSPCLFSLIVESVL
jgi:hypothetical protein